MSDLEDVTTVDLIQELKRRSRALVIGFDPLADRSLYTVLQHGSKLSVSGMLRALTLDSDDHLKNDPRDRPPEPDV